MVKQNLTVDEKLRELFWKEAHKFEESKAYLFVKTWKEYQYPADFPYKPAVDGFTPDCGDRFLAPQ